MAEQHWIASLTRRNGAENVASVGRYLWRFQLSGYDSIRAKLLQYSFVTRGTSNLPTRGTKPVGEARARKAKTKTK